MKLFVCNILLIGVLLTISACSSDTETQKTEIDSTKASVYESWETAQYQNIKVVFPPGHLFTAQMTDNAKLYKTVLRRNAQFFRLPEPTDTIVMFYFTGFGQGQEITQSEFPSINGDTVYYWSGNTFGIPSAMYMLHKWTNVEPKYKFLYHGIMRLLDASGRDYHSMTFTFIDSNKFMPLAELITNERTDYNWEAYQSAEAASFIDYFVFKYGIDNFKLLYESQLPFDSTVQSITKLNTKYLQKDWLKVISQVIKK